MSQPLVSVWLITYNHAAYIAEAIEGVLRQQTSFPVELIIGDDYSTDGTRAIVQAYKNRYPKQITLFLAEANMGMVDILRPTSALCRGKYVAMLDGDDYWTDPLKLQKQVDQLERDPAACFSFHKVSVLHQNTGEHHESAEPSWSGRPGELRLPDLLHHSSGAYTLSVLYRNDFGPLPEWYYHLPFPDAALFFLLLMHGGTAQYLPDNMGVYRVHGAGWFSSLSPESRYAAGVDFFTKLGEHLPAQYRELLSNKLSYLYYELVVLSLKKRRLRKAAGLVLRMSAYTRPSTPSPYPRSWSHGLLLTSIKYTSYVMRKAGVHKKLPMQTVGG